MAVASKPSAAASTNSSATLPDFPEFAPGLVGLTGGQETNAAIQQWWNTAKYQFLQQNTNLQVALKASAQATTGLLQAEIDTERIVRADADSALASSITSVSASLTTAIGIVAASVTTEAAARATADGFLSANYSITVTAGSVVTGMQLNSSLGGGATSSTIDFQGANFRIWDGTATAYPVFATSVGSVKLANTLTVNTTGKVFIGTGTYANSNTAWYVDSTGQFSLKDKLTWDGSTLTISGSISATTGTIGGWTVNSTTLSNNNAVLDSAGNLLLGTSNDVVILSATDATYRIWVGNATAGSASFRVTKAGVMTAVGGVFTGSLTSVSGTIGGFTIGSKTLTAGSGTNYIELSNDTAVTFPYLLLGDLSGRAALYSHAELDFTNASAQTVVILGSTTNTYGTLTLKDGATTNLVISGQASAGIVFGGDTNLYRSSADVLKTDDALVVGANLGVLGQIILTVDTNLYRASANLLRTDDDFYVAGAIGTAGALTFGGDTNIYRASSNLLKTDDDFSVAGSVGVSGSANIVGTLTLNTDVNLYRDSANVLKTDDNMIVNLEIVCGGGVSASADALKVQSGYFKYGTYVATPVTNTGYIEMKDIFGTVCKIMIGS